MYVQEKNDLCAARIIKNTVTHVHPHCWKCKTASIVGNLRLDKSEKRENISKLVTVQMSYLALPLCNLSAYNLLDSISPIDATVRPSRL